MFKLKNILLSEDIDKSKLEDFKKECAPFLNFNFEELKSGNILKRGTTKSYNNSIIKKDFRKREEARGIIFNTWLYEYFRPDDHPSREYMIPTQNGKLSDIFRSDSRNSFGVFPIGRQYKLQYSKRVKDFNVENPYFPKHTILNLLLNIKRSREDYNLNEKQVEKLIELIEFYNKEISSDYDVIRKVYKKIWNEVKQIEDEDPKIQDRVRIIRDSAEAYFHNGKISKEVPKKVGLEVNLYAPQGFYYVSDEALSQVI